MHSYDSKAENSWILKGQVAMIRHKYSFSCIKDGSGQMELISLGKEGLKVPAIGLGCMGMSDFYGSSSEDQNLKVLSQALAMGCTFWDTSDMYGPFTNELLLGKALKGQRDKITLASKFGISRGDDGSWKGIKGHASYVKECCDASLKRLGTDYIDLYYQHRLDPDTPIEETVSAMSDLVKAGKVRYLGLSEADPETIKRAHKVHPISALQTEYSLWTRDVEKDILPTLTKLNIGFVAYSPLGRGFLSGAIKSRKDLEPGDWRLENPRFTEEAIAQNNALAEKVSSVATDLAATPAQVALAWILSRSDHMAAIPGTRKLERLEENWKSQNLKLEPQHLELLDSLVKNGVAGSRY